MKALILAAGLGTRLAPITDSIPKSLVPVNGKPILFKQIENLYANEIYDITIISGYKAAVLEKEIHKYWPSVNIIESVDYASTNNMYSAYIGLKYMFSKSEYEPFLMMNADVFFDESIINSLITDNTSNAIVVDLGRYIEESMKVRVENGHIVEISKSISSEQAAGCSIDVYKFDSVGGKAFYNRCVEYIESNHELKLWSEVALNAALKDVNFVVCPLNGRWLEIDNHDDLAEAEKLFAEDK